MPLYLRIDGGCDFSKFIGDEEKINLPDDDGDKKKAEEDEDENSEDGDRRIS
jgi:hypothetical protein